MISLTRSQRAALLFVSASAYLAWYAGFGERLEAQSIAGTPPPSLTIAAHGAPPRLSSVIVRDPFAGAPAAETRDESDRNVAPGAARTTPGANPPGRTTEAPLEATVPNIAGVRDASHDIARESGPATTLVVRATIVGRNPVAYVANGTVMDIVRIGDRLGDRRIGAIDLRGIGFTDGSRLDLPGAFVAAPSVPKAASSVTIKLEDLRRLILAPGAASPPLAPGAGTRPTTPVAATTPPATPSGFPTPGPLPTVDARGIPVGTNPTPNANGPTPYPNPYPYAPPVPHR